MKNRRVSLVLTLALPVVLTTALPGRAPAVQLAPGSIELSPKVAFSHYNVKREGYGNVDTFTELDFTPTVGFCLTDRYEVTGGAIVRHFANGSERDTAFGALAGLTYNFARQGDLVPFAGVGFGVLSYQGFTFDDTTVLAPDLTAGVRVLIGDSGSLNVNLGYQRESDNHVSMNRLVAGVGLSLFPWHTR
jgi:hypothetical protein